MKLTVDFTLEEKKKLRKAKIGLRKLDEFSLNDILQAIIPDRQRAKEISKQFYGSMEQAGVESGWAGVMRAGQWSDQFMNGTVTGLDLLLSKQTNTMLGISSAIRDANAVTGMSKMVDQARKITEQIMGGQNHSFITGSNRMREMAAAVLPLSMQANTYMGIVKGIDLTGANVYGQVFKGMEPLLGHIQGITAGHSVWQQSDFKKLGIGAFTEQFNTSSIFERTHINGISGAFKAASRFNALADQNLGGFNWNQLGGRVNLASPEIKDTQDQFFALTTGYADAVRSITAKPNWVYEAPDLAKLPALDFYVSSRVLKIVSTDGTDSSAIKETDIQIAKEGEDEIRRFLPMVDPGLPKLWAGALESLNGNNPDKIRHFITSLRELFTHLIQILAPNAAMAQWDLEKKYLSDGKPTREGRFLFICRNLEGSKKEIAQLMQEEVASTLKLIRLFQGGTHGISPSFSPVELQFIRIKAESALRLFLSIQYSINEYH
jgi:Predicted pPIWI-associating nuclease